MDYKSVLEEQIRELQKRQKYINDTILSNGIKGTEEACLIAKTIAELIETARTLPLVND